MNFFKENCPQQFPHIKVIAYGIENLRTNSRHVAHVRNKFQICSPYLLYVGGFERDKNVVNLIEAFGKACNSSNQMLILTGPAPTKHRILIERVIRKNSNVKDLGYVTDHDLSALYSGADFFISSSLDEGFGFCPLEALQCGTPLICSDIPCFREVMGRRAIYFNPYDIDNMAQRIRYALQNKQKIRTDMDEKKIISKFNWKHAASETVELYRRIIKTSSTHEN